MAWLSRVNFIASDTLSFTDVNNLGNDIRAWGDNVNGGGYTLSNVVVSALAGTMATLSGGSAASSTLTLRSTSGAGTTDAIIFQTGSQVERMRITSGGDTGIRQAAPLTPLHVGAVFSTGSIDGNVTLSAATLMNFGVPANGASITWNASTNGGNTNTAMARVRPRQRTTGDYGLDVFVGTWNNNDSPTLVGTFESTGTLKLGGTADRATTAGTNQLVLFNGTAPVGTLANGASFYVTSGEMRVMDAAGNATLLSPHDRTTNEWIYDSAHTPTGKRLKINVEKLLRFVNEHLGLDCISELTGVAQ